MQSVHGSLNLPPFPTMPSYRREDFTPIAQEWAKILYSRHLCNLHIAFVYGPRNVLLATALNKVGSRSKGAGFSSCTIHAERAALKAVGDIRKLQGATMVVIRVGYDGRLMASKPCSECQCHLEKCMRSYGLRRVFYS
jgi:hypothetical protein